MKKLICSLLTAALLAAPVALADTDIPDAVSVTELDGAILTGEDGVVEIPNNTKMALSTDGDPVEISYNLDGDEYGDGKFTLNVGDSRMYLIHSGKISQVTKDHSYVQYLVDQGKMTPEEAKRSVNRNIITKAVGTEAEIEPDVFVTRIKKSGSASEYIGILCSDGLTNHVPPEVLCAESGGALDAVSDRALGHVCEKLIDLANDGGGADNITAVVFTL